ncbi:MAG: hypothetical protein HY695_03845 [Deltaproteobacteria bacterium]|nr:hypothetical protein [Deltaproteobacteria bacterium]
MEQQKRWEINVCQTGRLHVHYETGSLQVLKEGFLGLARELRAVADQLEALHSIPAGQSQNGS